MAERDIQAQALVDLSRGPIRLFRNNTGMGWAGEVIKRWRNHITIKNARPLNAGLCKGSSDTIGWYTVEITSAMVGKRVAVFAAVEFKDKTIPTHEQHQFILAVHNAGGVAGVAHSSSEAHQLFIDYLARLSTATCSGGMIQPHIGGDHERASG